MNKMNLTNLQSMASEKFTTKKIEIAGYEINIDTYFRDSKISAIIKEFTEILNYAKEKNISINNTDTGIMLIIEHFSDIEFPEIYEEKLKVYTLLVDLGLIEIIFSEFGEESIKTITDKLNIFNENIGKMTEELKKNNTKNFVVKKKK